MFLRRFWLFYIIIGGMLVACGHNSPSNNGTTATITPSNSMTNQILPSSTPALPTTTPAPIAAPTQEITFYNGPVPDGAIARFGKGGLRAIVLSPDQEFLFAGSEVGVSKYSIDPTAEVWSMNIQETVYSIDISPTGNLIAVGLVDGRVLILESASGQIVKVINGHSDSVGTVAFSPNGMLLASGSFDGTGKLWSIPEGQFIASFTNEGGRIWQVIFSPDSRLLSYASGDIFLWDISSQTIVRKISISTFAEQIAFSSDSKNLYANLSEWSDSRLTVWDVETGQQLHQLALYNEDARSMTLSSDNSMLAAGFRNGTVKIWDTQTWSLIKTLQTFSGEIVDIAFAEESKMLFTANHGLLTFWSLETFKPLVFLKGYIEAIDMVAFSPDNSRLASIDSNNNITLWDVESQQFVTSQHQSFQEDELPVSLLFSPDGTQLAVGGGKGTVGIWNVSDDHLIQHVEAYLNGYITAITYLPDSTLLIAVHNEDDIVETWDASLPEPVMTLIAPSMLAREGVFSADGSLYASVIWDNPEDRLADDASFTSIVLWQLVSGQIVHVLEGHPEAIVSLQFLRDGNLLASASYNPYHDSSVRLWDIDTGQLSGELPGGGGIWSIVFSPDGEVYACSSGAEIILWDMNSLQEITRLQGHTNSVNTLALNSDGSILASGSLDGTIILWPIEDLLEE